jgi:hypothetical protein
MTPLDWGKRTAVAVVVAVVVVVAAAGVGAVLGDDPEPAAEPPTHPEWDPASVVSTPQTASGEIRAEDPGTDGLVVIDTTHANGVTRSEVTPLVEALTRVGYAVEFTSGNLSEALSEADAYLVIDPGTEYSPDEVEAVREFTDSGGRLLVAAEPDRRTVQTSLFGASISTRQSRVTTLASEYGVAADASYLYNLETNGGNYRYLTAEPATDVDGVSSVTLYTATAVTAADGRVVLRAAPGTRSSADTDDVGRPAVAVRTGNAIFLGDSTFLTEGRHNVADNEAFLAYLVEFATGGTRPTAGGGGAEATPGASDGRATGSGASDAANETATAKPAADA